MRCSEYFPEPVLTECLAQVVMAMRTKGGDQAVFHSLNRARELYLKRLQENTAVNQLASLFAECAIAEAQPLQAEQTPLNDTNCVGCILRWEQFHLPTMWWPCNATQHALLACRFPIPAALNCIVAFESSAFHLLICLMWSLPTKTSNACLEI
ncbi:hypothetical protein OIU78_016181 [Salix suchowensis]|nr:hypothetical protein OIU78_016181 [Salix suchowensis]